ncbi:hypothetical protein V6N11_074960 [Hibiscus sabdariffa]|uniref:Carboxypeptidase n=1 Tax=Hibiscus sabdariffa TaxID=183260 RepID=A0ABR2R552_9ROSI
MGFLGWRSAALCLILLEVLFSLQVECFPGLFDRISGLPGQPQVEFQQYSGYVTVDEKKQRALFYYLQKLKLKQIQLPSLLSYGSTEGLDALHLGLEPFPRMDRLGLVGKCWSRTNIAGLEQSHCFAEANMLYLESPIGVGFSFSADDSSYEDVNDKTTARDNLVFLQNWFLKFPHYRNRSLFITGESYAGHYIPQLAELITRFNKKEKLFNLKGIALGNPVLEFATDFNSRAEFFWSHGLIPDSTYKLFTTSCNYSRYVGEYYRGNVSPICSRVMSQVSTETSRFVDKYDVTLDVCISSVFSQSKILTPQVSLPKQQVGETIDVCVEDETVNYLNRQDVQKALHARLVGVLDYELLDIEIPTITIVGRLLKAGIPVMVYSGDQDSVIPLTGSRTLVNQLAKELGLRTTVAYRVWFAGQQVGGWTQVYGNILSFATVRGASHEAPFSQPERSLVLFKAFIEGQPLPEAF